MANTTKVNMAYMQAEIRGKIQAESHHRSYLDHCMLGGVECVRRWERVEETGVCRRENGRWCRRGEDEIRRGSHNNQDAGRDKEQMEEI
jgi:hypothetical protein